MLKRLPILLGLITTTTAWTSAEPSIEQALAVPRGATIGSEGYATILDAPPAPFTPAAPGKPPARTPKQLADERQFQRASEFQAKVRDEVMALHDKLRRAEKGNFVDLYFENEGEPHVVFRFLRKAEATLARYTRDPRFRAETARFTNAQLVDAMDFMLQTFQNDRVILGGGTGNKENRAVIDIAITEEEFRALAARKGVKIPAAVQLNFVAKRPASTINRPLPPTITRLVRIFPRDDRPIGAVPSIASRTKVVLRDGCFRAADQGDALVLFPLGAQLFIDHEGYIAFGDQEIPGYARVGETIVFEGTIDEVTALDLVEPIQGACGSGKVVRVNGMRSAAAERAQDAVETNARALRDFREMYGLPDSLARKLLERCKAHVGGEVCLLSPPPPVRSQADCPAGAKLSGGLCRTPEGYIRPIPKWLGALLER